MKHNLILDRCTMQNEMYNEHIAVWKRMKSAAIDSQKKHDKTTITTVCRTKMLAKWPFHKLRIAYTFVYI